MNTNKSIDSNFKIEPASTEKKDANTCMALGVGVGTLGAISASLTGAVCPLCIVIAPALVGYGAYRRWKVGSASDKKDGVKSFLTKD